MKGFEEDFEKLRRRIESSSGWNYLEMDMPLPAQNSMIFEVNLRGERRRDRLRINFNYSFNAQMLSQSKSANHFIRELGVDLIHYVESFVHCGCKQWEDETGKMWYIKCEEHLNVN